MVIISVMSMSEDVVLIGGARTPFCEWLGGKRGDGEVGGRLADVSAEQLGSIAIRGALEKTGTSPDSVDHLVMGHALQTSDQAIFGARHAGLNAGIPQGLEEIAKRLALLDDNSSLVGNSEQLFSSVVFFAIFYMVAQTALTTLGVIFYNLVSDIVGGVEIIVLEESYSDQKEVMPKKEERKKSDNRETLAMTFSKTLKKLKDKKEPEPFQVIEEGEEKS